MPPMYQDVDGKYRGRRFAATKPRTTYHRFQFVGLIALAPLLTITWTTSELPISSTLHDTIPAGRFAAY
ncbi:MAG: hypothetical protein IPH78_13295 [Bacteroidetes bacterium]|nr:hypothetical protein [Bacteroidota bacterium]